MWSCVGSGETRLNSFLFCVAVEPCQRCRPLSARACRVREIEMDSSSSDLEFFDFQNATEEEIKEIQAILKGPGSNGCVELPWEIPLKENCNEDFSEREATEEKTVPSTKATKALGTVVGHALHFATAQTPLSPVSQLPPPGVEAFVTLPTTVGPYPNAPYFVSRTIPYLRTYPHMGVPLFACPLPAAGETSPYGQFVPVVPTSGAGQEKFAGQIENDSNQKSRGPAEKQFHRRKKKSSSTEYSGAFESENTESYQETVLGDEIAPTSVVTSAVSNERPTSMPLVPLPGPPSTFAVAGGALPLHGYPPGLHTLPYTQMSGPQAPSTAMYYVPVFNHPYGSYIPSPPAAPMVLPVNLRPESEVNELTMNKCSKDTDNSVSDNCAEEEILETVNPLDTPTSLAEPCENALNVQSNCKTATSVEQCVDDVENLQQVPVDSIAKSTNSEKEEVTDSNSVSDPLSKSISSSPDCLPETVIVDDCYKRQPANEEIKEPVRDPSRCWADLFKKPCSEVNGIDRQLPPEHRHKNTSTFKKDIANGKMYSVPASDSIH